MPRSRPAVIARRRGKLIGGPTCDSGIQSAYHGTRASRTSAAASAIACRIPPRGIDAMHKLAVTGAVLLIAIVCSTYADAATCESLTAASLPKTTVTLAQNVAPGAFTQPGGRGGRGGASAFAALPAFCRVAVTLKPTPRSDIKSEVWMPASGWNGKLHVVGNGGFAGTISYPAMAAALASGYATASTDTGHTGPAANTFVNDDVLVDYAYRAIHETTAA